MTRFSILFFHLVVWGQRTCTFNRHGSIFFFLIWIFWHVSLDSVTPVKGKKTPCAAMKVFSNCIIITDLSLSDHTHNRLHFFLLKNLLKSYLCSISLVHFAGCFSREKTFSFSKTTRKTFFLFSIRKLNVSASRTIRCNYLRKIFDGLQ